ncbi:cation diffusion facilitator 1 [Piedraia hortae CBS 480.64]|uniref:Cation diffusion facilitator 1 n=1 Tax=Piedraia hortae CBS 480.64 TaxID=1314780 RepID=A0A6A7C2H7_9PEZI|nr:cation diffusion facilitator 1 [Piedraia hortae CBS 480.64]
MRNSMEEGDTERGTGLPGYNDVNDPFKLRDALMTDEQMAAIKANSRRKRIPLGKSPRAALHAHKLRGFYRQQNEKIERWLKPVHEHVQDARDEQGSDALQYRIAVGASLIANILLAVIQLYAAIGAGSLSLFATAADAVCDPLSNLTLLLCHRAVNRVDPRKYPSGKARIETAGNITFGFVMACISVILITVSSIQLLQNEGRNELKPLKLTPIIVVGVAFLTKFSLFIYCFALRNKYSQVRILWLDHRNDMLINGFGLTTAILGSRIAWWIDPAGAIAISILIAGIWIRTCYSEFQLLIGQSADTAFLQHVTYISMTHSPLITQLDTVRAWHSGPRLIVEVDVVVDKVRTVEETHDVAEDLQRKLESLPDVERCYVHVDYETSHAPEHFWKKEL